MLGDLVAVRLAVIVFVCFADRVDVAEESAVLVVVGLLVAVHVERDVALGRAPPRPASARRRGEGCGTGPHPSNATSCVSIGRSSGDPGENPLMKRQSSARTFIVF